MVYEDDYEARLDWDTEREAFMRDGDEDDLPPPRFWVDTSEPLPVVRDSFYHDAEVARFITLWAAGRYRTRRNWGMGHGPARLGLEGG